MHPHSPNPRIVRLTPLDTALDRLGALVSPARPSERPVALAVGTVSASDIRAPASLPVSPVAYADGWAVNAEELVGASAYSAAILAPPPPWVNADDAMPEGADAVLPADALAIVEPGIAEASSPIAQGDGVRRTGQDVTAGALIIAEGMRLAPRHAAILMACGIDERKGTYAARPYRRREPCRGAAVRYGADVAGIVRRRNRRYCLRTGRSDRNSPPASARPASDLVISLGGTGEGRDDCAVAALADVGRVDVQGIALRPGTSAAFGQSAGVPVLLLPGRLDALIAGALVLLVPALARISGLAQRDWHSSAKLADKASSVIGFSELFLGVPQGDAIQPVPLNEAGLDVLARAEGWFTVPPGSEGLAAGQIVQLSRFQPR